MKNNFDIRRNLDSLLATALATVVLASGFALLHAFTGGNATAGLIAPIFVPA